MNEENKPDNGVVENDAVVASFAAGNGVLALSPDMSETALLSLIKTACTWSCGKAFTVIPPHGGNVGGLVTAALLSGLRSPSVFETQQEPKQAHGKTVGHMVLTPDRQPASSLNPFLLLDGHLYRTLSKHLRDLVLSLRSNGAAIGICVTFDYQGTDEKELSGATDAQADEILVHSQSVVRVSLNPAGHKSN